MVRKCGRSTWEGKAAEVCGGTGISQDHTEHPARVSLELLLDRKESWFISVQLIPLLIQGLGRMFFQLGFCSPQGGTSQSPAPSSAPADSLGTLLSSWATTVFPAGIRGDPHPGIQARFCLWCQRIESGIGGVYCLVSPEGSLMFREGGARQVWCKKEEVVGGLAMI